MAVSSVSISNRALQRLGAERIAAMDQDHPNARSCNTAYEPVRRALLRLYAWSFAKSRASVAVDSTKTLFDNLNRYLVPNDFIRLLRPMDRRVDWEIEGRYIITKDAAPLQFRYLFDESNPANFDPLFVEALACKIAYEICEEVTGSTAKKQGLAADMTTIINQARQANSFERDADVPLEDDFVLAMR
jgi:hypothetical protein